MWFKVQSGGRRVGWIDIDLDALHCTCAESQHCYRWEGRYEYFGYKGILEMFWKCSKSRYVKSHECSHRPLSFPGSLPYNLTWMGRKEHRMRAKKKKVFLPQKSLRVSPTFEAAASKGSVETGWESYHQEVLYSVEYPESPRPRPPPAPPAMHFV